jgi:glycosyltransferase involved in cell wall biosynthesis
MNTLRLCLIANPNSIHTVRWVRYFAQRGHDVHLLGDKPLAGPPPAGATVYDLSQAANARKLRYVVWAQVVRRLVRKIRPDVLHAHQVTSAGWLGAAAGYHPFLVTSWGSDLLLGAQRSQAQRQLARWVLRCADYVTCVSQRLAEAARAFGAAPQRVEVVPWGVDTRVFHPAEDDGLTSSSPVVLSIRAMRPLYNPLHMARAVPLVLDQIPAARFIIRTYNAEPALLARFRSLVEAAGAAHAVEYVADLPDDAAIADLYRTATVAVSVPSSDGTPQSVLEAMACGAVPVLSDLPALRAWVAQGVQGLFVPVGDDAALATAVVQLLADADKRRAMRNAAIRLVEERADSLVWMQRYAEIYQQLAARAALNNDS